jgi:hypothetical protein
MRKTVQNISIMFLCGRCHEISIHNLNTSPYINVFVLKTLTMAQIRKIKLNNYIFYEGILLINFYYFSKRLNIT